MIVLSENGIRDLVHRKVNDHGYIFQVLYLEAVRGDSYKVKVSDGFGSVDATFIGGAAQDIKHRKIFENSVIQLDKYEFDRAGESELHVILVTSIVVVRPVVNKVIGDPIPYHELKELDFRNPKGSNKLKEGLEEEQLSLVGRAENYIYKTLANFGFSFVAGLCAAYFVKKIVKAAAFIAGGFFLTLQIMAYNGLVTIHWHKFKPARIDLTKFLKIISVSSGGFGLGFYVGIRKDIQSLLKEKYL